MPSASVEFLHWEIFQSSRGQKVSHRRWNGGIHCAQCASEWSIPTNFCKFYWCTCLIRPELWATTRLRFDGLLLQIMYKHWCKSTEICSGSSHDDQHQDYLWRPESLGIITSLDYYERTEIWWIDITTATNLMWSAWDYLWGQESPGFITSLDQRLLWCCILTRQWLFNYLRPKYLVWINRRPHLTFKSIRGQFTLVGISRFFALGQIPWLSHQGFQPSNKYHILPYFLILFL